jgi:hypothetical protein
VYLNGKIRPDRRANRLDHLQVNANAVGNISTVFVCPLVCQGRQELKVTMRGMYFHGIKARFSNPATGVFKGIRLKAPYQEKKSTMMQ